MKSSSGAINIAARARRVDVDNRISLRCYYRIADNLIKQADIYREEKNIIDLYVMLLRFSSLITETIPYHQDYQLSLQSEKLQFRKILLNALGELEMLKPAVQQQLEELNCKSGNQVSRCPQALPKSLEDSFEWPFVKKQTPRNTVSKQASGVSESNRFFQDPVNQWNKFSHSKSISQQFYKMLSFLVAEACLLAGANIAYHSKYMGYFWKKDLSSCAALRKGIFAAAAVMVLVSMGTSLIVYWIHSKADTGGWVRQQNVVLE